MVSALGHSSCPRGPDLLKVVADYERLSAVQGAGRAGNGQASGLEDVGVSERDAAPSTVSPETPGVNVTAFAVTSALAFATVIGVSPAVEGPVTAIGPDVALAAMMSPHCAVVSAVIARVRNAARV